MIPARAEFQKVIASERQSFYWRHIQSKFFDAPYHFHPEFELIHIASGRGRRLVGSSIGHFGPDDLVLIAPNVPHIFQIAPECPMAETVYVQFLPGFLGANFFQTPEMRKIGTLLASIDGGVTFDLSTRKGMTERLKAFSKLNETDRLFALLEILDRLSGSEIIPVGKYTDSVPLNRREEERISRVFAYLNENLCGPISQAEIARSVRLSSAAFSRLFKKTTGKCFMQVVNDLRIAQVCRLLAETNRTVSEIAFSCGYESLSSFHIQFRRITNTTPVIYRQRLETIVRGSVNGSRR